MSEGDATRSDGLDEQARHLMFPRLKTTGGRYFALLALLLAVTVLAFAVENRPWLRAAYIVLVGATLVQAMRASGERTRSVHIAEVVASAASVFAVAEAIADREFIHGSTTLLASLLLAFVPVALVRRFARQRTVTLETVLAVICIYFVFALIFSFAYATLDAMGTQPFFSQGSKGGGFDFVYFSFITITTTGFGDLTARANLGRAMAMSEAFLGQVFLVTVVARLVSLWRPRAAGGVDDQDRNDA
jgi:hypothetical protein